MGHRISTGPRGSRRTQAEALRKTKAPRPLRPRGESFLALPFQIGLGRGFARAECGDSGQPRTPLHEAKDAIPTLRGAGSTAPGCAIPGGTFAARYERPQPRQPLKRPRLHFFLHRASAAARACALVRALRRPRPREPAWRAASRRITAGSMGWLQWGQIIHPPGDNQRDQSISLFSRMPSRRGTVSRLVGGSATVGRSTNTSYRQRSEQRNCDAPA